MSSVDDCLDISISWLEKGLLRRTPGDEGKKEEDNVFKSQLSATSDMMKAKWSADRFDQKKNLG